MDRKFHQKADLEKLIQLAALSRGVISADVAALKHKLDFPSRVRSSLKENPMGWLMGSMASGWATSLLFRKKNKPQKGESLTKKRGMALTLLGLGFSALQPLGKIWLTNQLKHYLSSQRLSINPRPSQFD